MAIQQNPFQQILSGVENMSSNPIQDFISGLVGRVTGVGTPKAPSIGQTYTNFVNDPHTLPGQINQARNSFSQRTGMNPNDPNFENKFLMSPESQGIQKHLGAAAAMSMSGPSDLASGQLQIPGTENTATETGGKFIGQSAADLQYKPPIKSEGLPSNIQSEIPGGVQKFPQDITQQSNTVEPTKPVGPGASKNPDNYVSPVKVILPKRPGDIGVMEDQNAAQTTLNTYVPGNTATDVANNIKPAIAKFGNDIESAMQANPKTVNTDDVVNNFKTTLTEKGIPVAQARGSTLSQDPTQVDIQNYINNLYKRSNPTSEGQPTVLTDKDVYQARVASNQDMTGVWAKIENGQPLTVEDKVKLAGFDTLDKTLSEMHPEVKESITNQRNLYNSMQSAGKASDKELTAKITPQPNLLQRLIRNPFVETGIGALIGGGAVSGLPTLLPKLAGGVENFVNGLSSKPQTQPGSQPTNQTPPVSLPTHMQINDIKSKTGVPVTMDEYNQALNDQPGMYAQGSNARDRLETNMSNTKQIASQNMPGNIPKFMGTATNAYQAGQNIESSNLGDISKVLNNLPGINSYKSYTSGPYATEIQQLGQFNDYFTQAYSDITGQKPGDEFTIKSGDSPQQIKAKLDYQLGFISQSYSKYQPYWDAINPTPGSNAQTSNQQTVNTQSQSQGLPPMNNQQQGLPAIPTGFKITQ